MRPVVPSSAVPIQLRHWRISSARPTWIFGGAVRDLLLGRQPYDWDLAVRGDALEASRRLAKFCRGRWIELNPAFQQYRVLAGKRQYDLQPLPAGDLEGFLRSRDFSVNALALELPAASGATLDVLDPADGLRDLKTKTLRPIPGSLAADPVRALRGIRTALELGFRLPPRTIAEIRAVGPKLWTSAAERIRDELMRIILFWPERAVLVRLALALVLGPQGPMEPRLKRLRLQGVAPDRRPLLTLAAALQRDHARTGRRLRLSRAQVRFLDVWERLRSASVSTDWEWLLGLARSGENPLEISRVAVAAGNPRQRILALRNERYATRLKAPMLDGNEAGRLAEVSGPALGRLLAELQVEQALGKIRNKKQAIHWIRHSNTGTQRKPSLG